MKTFTAAERVGALENLIRWSATGVGDLLDLVDQALTIIRSDPTDDELRQALNFYEYIQKYALPALNVAARVRDLEAQIDRSTALLRRGQSKRRIAALEAGIATARAEIASLT